MKKLLLTAVLASCAGMATASAEVFPRSGSSVGSVIARKMGEEARFVEVSDWRLVDVRQDLLPGDVLRTNALGHLALLFSDHTQMRLGRNTTLVVKRIGAPEDTLLDLETGTIWGRAERGGLGLTVETPAAAAAIRGTDWSMTVEGDRTSLVVLEGQIEFHNPQGSVLLGAGEGAFARIGEAPTKYVLVDLAEREQLLLYGELRSAFSDLPITGTTAPQARSALSRIKAKPESARSDEDWLQLAETSLALEGRAAAEAALSRLRRPLPPQLEARAKLVQAMLRGQQQRYDEAASLFSAAIPGLDRERQAAAAYGRWFAEALGHPDRAAIPPAAGTHAGSAAAVLARALAASHLLGQAAAIEILREAEPQFPNDARLPAMRADLAFQLDRRQEVEEALAKAFAIDPDEPAALLISGRYRATVASDLDGAMAELGRAVAAAPGADAVWNEIGIVQGDRNTVREADAAFRRAVSLNPENAAVRANYARFLMDNDQLAAAKAQLDAAEAIDPSSYAVLAAKGRYLLRLGRVAEAEQSLRAAAALNPTYADGLIGLAIAGYQQGPSLQTEQALDNADRFDPENPAVPLIRSGIAIDSYRADDAILNAREALRRRQQRGGYFSGFDPNRQVTSYLGIALDFLELDEWSRFYTDRSFDPFRMSTYLDEAASGSATPFLRPPYLVPPDQRIGFGGSGFVSQLQGLMLDPLAAASQTRRNTLERIVFNEFSAGGGFIAQDGSTGWSSDLVVQGTSYTPLPFSYYVQAEAQRPDLPRPNDRDDVTGGSFMFGLHPTLETNLLLFGNTGTLETGFPGQVFAPTLADERETSFANLGAAWSQTLGERNLLQAFVVANRNELEEFSGDIASIPVLDALGFVGPYTVDRDSEQDGVTAGVSHLLGVGQLTFRYGLEASLFDGRDTTLFVDSLGNALEDGFVSEGNGTRAYLDAIWDAHSSLRIQGGISALWFDEAFEDEIRTDPRIGIAWAPTEKQWLRAFYREDTQFSSNYTLQPISTVGLVPLEAPLVLGGDTRTWGATWDAEWTDRFFTSIEYQHQRIDGLSIDIPELLGTFDSSAGEVDRFSAAANYWIGRGFGAFASFAWHDSEDLTFGGNDPLPLVPDYIGRVGLTFIHPSKLKFTLAQTFTGERFGGVMLEPFSTTDLSLRWVSPSGHLEAGFQVLNAFDEDFELAVDIPGPGRTFLGTLRARF